MSRRTASRKALATINGNMARQVKRKRITDDDKQAALKRISTADSYDGFGDCDLVIEAATEKEEVKRKIFTELCPHLKPGRDHRHATPRRSRSRGLPPRPTGPSTSSASIS